MPRTNTIGSWPRGLSALDRSSAVPLYFQIAQLLQADIDSSAIPAGSRLENEVELSERLGVSRPTIRQAIRVLVDQGLLVRRRGIGTIVVRRFVKRPIALTSLYDDLSAAGRMPATRVLSMKVRPCPDEVAGRLSLTLDTPVVIIERLRFADGEPIALMHNYLPSDLLSLDTDELASSGLYELLRARGISPVVAEQSIGSRVATAREAKLLEVPARSAVLTMTRVAFADSGRPIEYGSHLYPGSRYILHMSLVSR
jgi:DNA-binding GntR family transcriptional regulator